MSRPVVFLGIGSLVLGSLAVSCGKHPIASTEKKIELHDHGTACLRVTGPVLFGPGMRTVEATVTARDRRSCTDYDMATCTIDYGKSGEIVIGSTLSLFPPYGDCADGGLVTATCSATLAAGQQPIAFGRRRETRQVYENEPPICLDN